VILVLLAFGLLLLALPGLAPQPPRRLPPHEWVTIALLATLAGAGAVLGALVLAAVPALATVVGVPAIADHCRGALAPLATEPTFVSWIAAAAATALLVRMVTSALHSTRAARRARVEAWLGDHHAREDFDVVTVPTDSTLAFGVPGPSPQVVISTGLAERLGADELEAVVSHEAAHLRLHHSTVLAVLHGIEASLGMLPFVRRTGGRLRAALEVWADAAALGEVADRRSADPQTRRSALRTALVGLTSTGCIITAENERIARLARRPSPRPLFVRAMVYAPVLVLVVAVGLTAVGWFTDAHHAVALGDPCTH
jgi:Zn-dependent protease with chaperone function